MNTVGKEYEYKIKELAYILKTIRESYEKRGVKFPKKKRIVHDYPEI